MEIQYCSQQTWKETHTYGRFICWIIESISVDQRYSCKFLFRGGAWLCWFRVDRGVIICDTGVGLLPKGNPWFIAANDNLLLQKKFGCFFSASNIESITYSSHSYRVAWTRTLDKCLSRKCYVPMTVYIFWLHPVFFRFSV